MAITRPISSKALQPSNQILIKADLEIPAAPAPTIDPNAVGRLPSVFNLLSLPSDFFSALSALWKARAIGDAEGEIDATLRLSTLPLNALSSISDIATVVLILGRIASFVRVSISPFTFLPMSILSSINFIGLALSAIESVVEALAVDRQVKFLSNFHLNSVEKIDKYFNETDPQKKRVLLAQSCSDLCHKKGLPISIDLVVKLQKLELLLLFPGSTDQELLSHAEEVLKQASKQILQKDAEKLQEQFLTLSPSEKEKIQKIAIRKFPSAPPEKIAKEIEHSSLEILKVKSNSLARRVEPWCSKELSTKLAPALKNMKSSDPVIRNQAEKEIKELLSTTKIQAKKYLMYHIVSLCVFVASTLLFIALIASCPPLIPVFILTGLGIASTTSYILYCASINQRGWKLSAKDCIPSVVKYIYKKGQDLYNHYTKPMNDRLITSVTSSAGLKRSYQAT